MANEMVIPALHCCSIDETLDFYVALGFEVTYRQERPNNYSCVAREGIQLHFFTMKGYDDPAQSYSTYIVLAPEVETLRRTFMEGAKAFYGKIPAKGIPRIGRLLNREDNGVAFNVVDPGGNWIRISQIRGAQTSEAAEVDNATLSMTTLAKAYRAADTLGNRKGDFPAAAKVLDNALAKPNAGTTIKRVQELITRAAIAMSMDDNTLAKQFLSDARAIPLSNAERKALSRDFEIAAEVEESLA